MADAVTSMFSEGEARTKIVVNLHCDASAFERGHTVAGERCEIEGIGPVPVSTARMLSNTGTIKTLGHDGADITRVAHNRRSIPAKLRSAIEARDRECVVPGCDVTEGLEIDHIIPLSEGGETTYGNLAPLCRYDHYLKTHHGYTLSGKPGAWKWSPPPPGWKPKRRFNRNE
ncbi:MAG: HNH endonuclease signature motif containing protein [Actinomycetota bacterium]